MAANSLTFRSVSGFLMKILMALSDIYLSIYWPRRHGKRILPP